MPPRSYFGVDMKEGIAQSPDLIFLRLFQSSVFFGFP